MFVFVFVFVFAFVFVFVFGINQPPLAQLRLLPARPSARTRPPAPALWSHTETCAQVFGEKEEMCLYLVFGESKIMGVIAMKTMWIICVLFSRDRYH